MGDHGYPWVPLRTHGYPLGPIGYLQVPIGTHKYLFLTTARTLSDKSLLGNKMKIHEHY